MMNIFSSRSFGVEPVKNGSGRLRVWWQDSECLAVCWQSSDIFSASGGSSGHSSGKWLSPMQSASWLLLQLTVDCINFPMPFSLFCLG